MQHLLDLTTAAERRAHVHAAAELDDDALHAHLEADHGLSLYEDDSHDDYLVMHDGAHRAPAPVPAAPPVPEVPQAVQEARAEVELYRLHQAEKAYDVDMPHTLRERMAYARSLASSALIPKAFRSNRGGDDGFRETTANVLLAVELGNTLGLSPLQALCQVNVVEGKPGLGAEGQLAQVLKAGHDLYVDDSSDRTQATVVAQRKGSERVQRITYTLDDAVAAGLVRIVEGRPYARSATANKPLPWETSTPDMLVWRAITRACKRVFPDVTGGLAVVDDEPGTQYAQGAATTTAAQEAPARASRPAATDSVVDDLALFTEQTGPWWQHAGADVRRRNKLQLAADRLAEARKWGDDRVPAADDVVDAELVDEGVPAGPMADDDLGTAPAVVVDVGQEVADLQDQLAREQREASTDSHLAAAGAANDAGDPATETHPVVTEAAAVTDPAVAGTVGHMVGHVTDDAPPAALDRTQLWDAVEALAAERGKTTTQVLARHTLATRTNPEDMTAEQLQAFLAAQRGL